EIERLEPSRADERAELLGVPERERGSHDRGGLWSDMPLERRCEDGEAGGWRDRAPDHDHDTTARTQHATHLAQPGRPVGEELKPELTEHSIERLISKRQLQAVGLPPFDRGTAWSREPAGNGKHARIEINRDDRASLAHPLGCDACHHA